MTSGHEEIDKAAHAGLLWPEENGSAIPTLSPGVSHPIEEECKIYQEIESSLGTSEIQIDRFVRCG